MIRDVHFRPSSSLSESNSSKWYFGGRSILGGRRFPGGALLVTFVVISLAATDIISVSGLDDCACAGVGADEGEVGDCGGSLRRMILRLCPFCAC